MAEVLDAPPLQTLIRELNENKGQEPVATPAATPVPETTPAGPTQQSQPAQNEPKPVAEPKKDEKPAAQATTIPDGSPDATPVATPEPKIDEPFIARLSELTDGSLKSVEDFGRLIDRYNQLEEEATKGFEPKFKDERAKLVYQLLEQSAGQEPEAAMRVLRALNFKREGKTDKDILFEAYLVDPKNADLTPIKAQELFDLEFDSEFSDLDNNPLKKRQLDLRVKDSLTAIERVQSDFKAADQEPAARNEKVEATLNGVLAEFGGVEFAFSDNPQDSELLKIVIEDPAELQAIQKEILNPHDAYNELLAQYDFNTRQGYADFVRETWERRNHKKNRLLAYEQGAKNERIKMTNEIRNASAPGDVSRTTPANPQSKGFLDSWVDAKKTG